MLLELGLSAALVGLAEVMAGMAAMVNMKKTIAAVVMIFLMLYTELVTYQVGCLNYAIACQTGPSTISARGTDTFAGRSATETLTGEATTSTQTPVKTDQCDEEVVGALDAQLPGMLSNSTSRNCRNPQCRFRGVYPKWTSALLKHTWPIHKKSNKVLRPGRPYDGRFDSDSPAGIWRIVLKAAGAGAGQPWRYEGDDCAKDINVGTRVGWTLPPTSGGLPTSCLRIIIRNRTTGPFVNAYPIPC